MLWNFFLMSNVSLFLKGVCVGIANIIPGLSGGTIAVIFGVYKKIIQSISNIISFERESFKNSMGFLMVIVLGAALGVFCFSYIIEWMITYYNQPLSYFFIGVLISSIPYIIKRESVTLFKHNNIVYCLFFAILGLGLVYLKFRFVMSDVDDNISSMYLFLSSFFASSFMVIPGVSGSLVFVLFGTYSIVVSSIKSLDVVNLSIIGLGAILGISLTSSVLSWCLKHYFQRSLSAIIGLMIGTIPGLYVGFSSTLLILNVFSLLMGLFIVWGLDFITKRLIDSK